ncbi:MAG: hypothetical protein AAF663_01160, partial [Planctomycetota bacterium]
MQQAVIETLEQRKLLAADLGDDWVLVDTTTVPADGTAVTTSVPLEDGVEYIVQVSGTADIGGGLVADSEYVIPSTGIGDADDLAPDGSDIAVAIANVERLDIGGQDASLHSGPAQQDSEYARTIVGTGDEAQFRFNEGDTSDNSGEFTARTFARTA